MPTTLNPPKTRSYTIGGRQVMAEVRKSPMGNRQVVTGPPPLWTIDQLPPLLVGDNLAFKAGDGFEEWAAARQGAVTWHWAQAGIYLVPTSKTPADYQIIGSINKGVATENLSAYEYRDMRIYRPVLPNGRQQELTTQILYKYGEYGAAKYDWLGVGEAAVIYLAKELGISLHLPITHGFYCIKFDAKIWLDMGLQLVEDWEHVTPGDMENSKKHELIWGTF